MIVATATDSPPPGRVSGNTSEFSFYPLASSEIVSISPVPIIVGLPYTVRVRATAAVGSPFKPNGVAQIQINDFSGSPALGRCEVTLLPAITASTSEGECVLQGAGSPGNVAVRASYNVTLGSFAQPDGSQPPTAQVITTQLLHPDWIFRHGFE